MERIAVIGIGRLGLCLALNLEKAGYQVTGLDLLQEYVDAVNTKTLRSNEPQVEDYLKASRNFKAITSYAALFSEEIKTLFVVVPTPSLPSGAFDHGPLDAVLDQLVAFGSADVTRHIVINSTTMPGYCDTAKKRLEGSGFILSYNPEFIAQGSIIRDQQYPDQVLIGEAGPEAGDEIERIYKRICLNQPVFCRMAPISAEITKLATNCFLTTKIAFANAIGDLASRAGAEPEKVLQAIGADSRIGASYFKYGFGYGGPCFPRDNRAFGTFAAEKQYNMLIGEATDAANKAHADFIYREWLRSHREDETLVFDSVTYKKGTEILEESQQLQLALSLARGGRSVLIREQPAVINALKEQYGSLFSYEINGQ